MYLTTSEQMAAIDHSTIHEFGVEGIVLMRRAGQTVVEEILARSGSVAGDRVAILCGRGNNGGDGFVIAKLLREYKAEPTVWVFAEPEKITGDAKLALDEWLDAGGEITTVTDDDAVHAAAESWQGADLIVDALLGTGLRGEVRGTIRTAIDAIGGLNVPVVAVDIPSGISADNGQVLGAAVRAVLTITFGLPKAGQAFYPGKEYCGTLCVADIGLAEGAVERHAGNISMTGRDDARSWLPDRRPTAHKGEAGKLLIAAGSVGMTGAAALSSEAALRAGAGLVYVACPESLNDILEVKCTEAVTLPMPEIRKQRCFSLRAVGDVRRSIDGMAALAVGPGLGRHRETVEFVRRIVSEVTIPTVIDADGLFALTTGMFPLNAPVVLTPHYGECARLLGMKISDVAADPLTVCRDTARALGVTMLLKGAPTVICGPSGEAWVNPVGNPGMATAGSGDVLTGIIVGLLVQGVEPETAARLGAYIHGMAGDAARKELGVYGMIAGDILKHVPESIRELSTPPAM